VKRLALVLAVAIGVGVPACGSGSAAGPTARPVGQRGTLLNPIDRSRSTVDQLNNQQQREEQQTGSGYP